MKAVQMGVEGDDMAMAERSAGDGTSWVREASCRGTDPAIFFPLTDEEAERALAICASCVVRQACLDEALEARERYGIWGGTTERERRRMLRHSA